MAARGNRFYSVRVARRSGKILAAACARVLAVSGLLFPIALSAADVYKWTDANGTTVYSDQAPPGPAQRISVESRVSDAASSRAQVEAERAAWARADMERNARAKADAAQRQALAAKKAEQCRAARSQSARFSFDQPHYRTDANGQRVYYSVAEIDRARAEAKKQMSESCEPLPRKG